MTVSAPKDLSWCRGNVVVDAPLGARKKTAGVSVELAARRRPSLGDRMTKYAREGHSPYDCCSVSDQPARFQWGGS
jgi:hypothetical protein